MITKIAGIEISSFIRILEFIKPYKRDAALALFFLTSVVGLDLVEPRLTQIIIDQGIALGDMQTIIQTSLIMIGASIISTFFAIANTIYAVRVSQNFAADLRRKMYQKIQEFSFGNLNDFQTGRLLVRLTSDVNQLQTGVLLFLRILTRAPLIVVGSIAVMTIININLSLLMIVLLSIAFILTLVLVIFSQPIFEGLQRRLDSLNQILEENLVGIRVVKAFVRRTYENERFEINNNDYMEQSVKVSLLSSTLMPLMILMVNLGVVAIIYFGGIRIISRSFTTGELIAFISYILTTMFPLTFLAITGGQASAAAVSIQRVFEILDSKPKIVDKPDSVDLPPIKGRVVFENVCFSYEENCIEPVLQNINLAVEPHQTVAVIGTTGSGKSSLVYLIPRFYDVMRGRITIDGVDIRVVTQNSLRSQIGVCLQEVILLSGTIRDNIKYGRHSSSDEEMIYAAKVAQAHDFIMRFPEGYDTIVGQRGVNLSGGQKQRIAIARALLVKPKILILDDSTSSVDISTAARIQDALSETQKDCTTFIIAQRISTVLDADKIVVLDRGRIIAEGTHPELIQNSPQYREIYESQLGDV